MSDISVSSEGVGLKVGAAVCSSEGVTLTLRDESAGGVLVQPNRLRIRSDEIRNEGFFMGLSPFRTMRTTGFEPAPCEFYHHTLYRIQQPQNERGCN